MRAQSQGIQPEGLADPQKTRIARDRQIAILYVLKGEAKGAVAEIMTETGVKRRTAYRAIQKELAWARATVKKPSKRGSA